MGVPKDFDRNRVGYRVEVIQVAKRDTYEQFENVIDELRYNIILNCLIDGEEKTKSIFQVTHFDVSQIKDFIPFEQLTQSTYQKWAMDHIESSNIEQLKDQALEEWFPSRVYVNV